MSQHTLHLARWVWLPWGRLTPQGAVLVNEQGVVLAAGPEKELDPPAGNVRVLHHEGLLTPGLVNAHTHLDLSWAAGRVGAGEGLLAWILALRQLTPPGDQVQQVAARQALAQAQAQGTQVVVDVGGGPLGATAMAHLGVAGAALWEITGRDKTTAQARLDEARRQLAARREPLSQVGVQVGVTPHAPYSLHPLFWPRVAGAAGPLKSLHFAEHPEEGSFWRSGEGPVKDFLRALGVPSGHWPPPHPNPLMAIRHQFSGPLLAVHGHFPRQFSKAPAGALRVVCPRSSQHIAGQAITLGRGPFALGTDSLASAPDLSVQEEAAALHQTGACKDPRRLWLALTEWPARHLGWLGRVGAFLPGATPGLVHFATTAQHPRDVLAQSLTTPGVSLIQASLAGR